MNAHSIKIFTAWQGHHSSYFVPKQQFKIQMVRPSTWI